MPDDERDLTPKPVKGAEELRFEGHDPGLGPGWDQPGADPVGDMRRIAEQGWNPPRINTAAHVEGADTWARPGQIMVLPVAEYHGPGHATVTRLAWLTAHGLLEILPAACQAYRDEHHLSLRAMGRLVGVNYATINRLERGREVQLSHAMAVLDVLGRTPRTTPKNRSNT